MLTNAYIKHSPLITIASLYGLIVITSGIQQCLDTECLRWYDVKCLLPFIACLVVGTMVCLCSYVSPVYHLLYLFVIEKTPFYRPCVQTY